LCFHFVENLVQKTAKRLAECQVWIDLFLLKPMTYYLS